MSIITEALRKAQKERLDNATCLGRKEDLSPVFVYQGKTVKQVDRVDLVVGKKKRHWVLPVFITGLAVIAVVAAFLIFASVKKGELLPVEHEGKVIITGELTAGPQKEETVSRSQHDTVKAAILRVRSEVSTLDGLPVLNGIMFSAESPMAILGDEIVSPGSRVKGFEVKSISPEKVSLYRDGKNYELKLN